MLSSIQRRSLKPMPSDVAKLNPRNLSRTLTWKEIPSWQKDNEYIVSGYRRVQNHWKGCFTSVHAYLHNETINIHSHLWGAVLFIYLLAKFNSQHRAGTTWVDSAVFSVFLSSAVICLSASSFYHTVTCHSEKAHLQIFYILSITLVGLGAAYIVLNPEYAKPTHRGARTAVFISLGLCALVPVSHLLGTYGSRHLFSEMGFGWLLASGGLYIIGALLYANRIPERLAPGRFDYFLASHQIFHVCVVLAALAHYYGTLKALDYRLSTSRPC